MPEDPDERLLALISMMNASTAAGDGEAVNAFRMATRALQQRGLSWREFALLALSAQKFGPTRTTTPTRPPRSAAAAARQAYEAELRREAEEAERETARARRRERERREDDLRRAEELRRAETARQAEAARRMHTRRERRQGMAVPTLLEGRIVVLDDNKGLHMVTIDVEDVDGATIHGPILAEGNDQRLRILDSDGKIAALRIRPPHSARFMPRVVGCRVLRR